MPCAEAPLLPVAGPVLGLVPVAVQHDELLLPGAVQQPELLAGLVPALQEAPPVSVHEPELSPPPLLLPVDVVCVKKPGAVSPWSGAMCMPLAFSPPLDVAVKVWKPGNAGIAGTDPTE